MAEDNQVTEEEVTKENKNSIEKDKTPKQLENWSKRVEKGQTEEHANLARRLQREKYLQKKEARTPTPAAAHRPHPTNASCALFKFDVLSRSSPRICSLLVRRSTTTTRQSRRRTTSNSG